jgi:hypothetical protein
MLLPREWKVVGCLRILSGEHNDFSPPGECAWRMLWPTCGPPRGSLALGKVVCFAGMTLG